MEQKTPTTLPPSPAAPGYAPKAKPAPKGLRRLVLEYGRPRLAALPTSKDRFIDFLKTMVWVVPLTLLIWVYAEREQYDFDAGPIECPIEVQGTSGRAAWFVDHPNHHLRQTRIKIRLEGPHSGILAVEDAINNATSGRQRVQINLGPDFDPNAPPETRTLINNSPLFVDNGVTVKECLPDKIQVEVELMESRLLPIEYRLPDTVKGTVAFNPPQVMVRAPASYFKELHPALTADLTNFPVLTQHTLHGVPLVSAYKEKYGDDLSFDPTTVTAEASAILRISEWTIPSIQVYVVMPTGLEAKYVVHYNQSVDNVKVTGPAAEIENLKKIVENPKPDQQQPRALLKIRPEDDPKAETTDVTRPVQFIDFPAGVSVEGGDYPVTFRLEKRGGDTP